MFTLIFGYLSAFVSFVGFPPYVSDIFKGDTKPERISWFIWFVLGLITFFSQLALGGHHSLWLPGEQTIVIGFIFFLSLWKGVGGFTKWDLAALLIAALGLVLWYFTKQPAVALIITLCIDAAGAVLTIRKTWQKPETETLFSWVCSLLAGVCAFIAVGGFQPLLLLYPLYS